MILKKLVSQFFQFFQLSHTKGKNKNIIATKLMRTAIESVSNEKEFRKLKN
jgi:hypothetical protein